MDSQKEESTKISKSEVCKLSEGRNVLPDNGEFSNMKKNNDHRVKNSDLVLQDKKDCDSSNCTDYKERETSTGSKAFNGTDKELLDKPKAASVLSSQPQNDVHNLDLQIEPSHSTVNESKMQTNKNSQMSTFDNSLQCPTKSTGEDEKPEENICKDEISEKQMSSILEEHFREEEINNLPRTKEHKNKYNTENNAHLQIVKNSQTSSHSVNMVETDEAKCNLTSSSSREATNNQTYLQDEACTSSASLKKTNDIDSNLEHHGHSIKKIAISFPKLAFKESVAVQNNVLKCTRGICISEVVESYFYLQILTILCERDSQSISISFRLVIAKIVKFFFSVGSMMRYRLLHIFWEQSFDGYTNETDRQNSLTKSKSLILRTLHDSSFMTFTRFEGVYMYPIIRVEPEYGEHLATGNIDPNGLIVVYEENTQFEEQLNRTRPLQNDNNHSLLQSQAGRLGALSLVDPRHQIAVSGRSTNIVFSAGVQQQQQSTTLASQTEATSTTVQTELNAPNNQFLVANANYGSNYHVTQQLSSSVLTDHEEPIARLPPLQYGRGPINGRDRNHTANHESTNTNEGNDGRQVNSHNERPQRVEERVNDVIHPQTHSSDEDTQKSRNVVQTSTPIRSTASSTENVPSSNGNEVAEFEEIEGSIRQQVSAGTRASSTTELPTQTTTTTTTSSSIGAPSNTTVGSEPSRSRFIPLSINFDKPRYPEYAVLTLRVNTYNDWPSYLDQTPRTMAKAGFFYEGYGDHTRCFFCGGGLRNWEAGDDPWVEHARWFPKCTFLRKNRGDSFVNMVQTRHQEAGHTGDDRGGMCTTGSAVMPSIAVQTLKEFGYDEASISEAIERLMADRENTGQTINLTELSATEICEVILQIEDENKDRAISETLNGNRPGNSGESSQTSTRTANDIAKENEELKDTVTCKVCMKEPVAVLFLPCGHLVCCLDCAPAMRECPFCNKLVKKTIKTFIP